MFHLLACCGLAQAAAAELEREAASLSWLATNTKPCPKCAYPIEKNGGCLHMRCQQCSWYFCWECGGPGSVCTSFKCLRSGDGGKAREQKRAIESEVRSGGAAPHFQKRHGC